MNPEFVWLKVESSDEFLRNTEAFEKPGNSISS
jgi:hypothetical protein